MQNPFASCINRPEREREREREGEGGREGGREGEGGKEGAQLIVILVQWDCKLV